MAETYRIINEGGRKMLGVKPEAIQQPEILMSRARIVHEIGECDKQIAESTTKKVLLNKRLEEIDKEG